MPRGKPLDITGIRYGRLTALEPIGKNKFGHSMWRCVCDCGREVSVDIGNLRNGNTKSCGCLNTDNSTKRIVDFNTKHGKTNTRLFRVWSSMKTRCENPNATNYNDYGRRGISICDEWSNDFEAFYNWAMSQGYNPNAKRGECTIDRIDNSKGYSPENCRLATCKEQANNRRNTRFITFNGITRSAAEWAEYYGRDITLFESLSDEDVAIRIAAYESYMKHNNVNKLPKRVNWRKWSVL